MNEPKRKIKIITFEEAENVEEQWRTIHDAIAMLEKIIIAFMGEFDEKTLPPLNLIRQNINNAKSIAYKRWQNINHLITNQPQ